MADRRVLLGTGAVLVGVGSALISANGIAAADTPDTDAGGGGTSTSASGASSATKSRGTDSTAARPRVRFGADRSSGAAKNDSPAVSAAAVALPEPSIPQQAAEQVATSATSARPQRTRVAQKLNAATGAALLSNIVSAFGGRPGGDAVVTSQMHCILNGVLP